MNNPGMLPRLRDFFRLERRALTGYVRARIADAAERDSEDIVQDVALHLFEKADITVPVEYLSSYIYTALRNRVIDYLRKRRRTVSMDSPVGSEDAGDTLRLEDLLHDARYDTADEIERREIRGQVREALGELSEREQALITATEFEGRTFAELSGEWEEPIGTLLARKSRAMKKIRAILLNII
jgi:RNA polymerase sigma factor (sigma-70 family)